MKDIDEPQKRPLALVVDDNFTMRRLICEALEADGFDVADAADGGPALELFETLRPDIVLLDDMMVKMDGFTTCAALRKLPGGEQTPILMVTNLDDIESIDRAYEAGATNFITKPINCVILGHRLRYVLRSRETLEQLRNSERRLANAQRIARLGHWEWDIEDNSLHLSREFHNIFGLNSQEFTSTPAELLRSIHPDDRDLFASKFNQAKKDRHPFSFQHRLLLSDGSERMIYQEAEIATDPASGHLQLIGTAQDITERKKAENEIRRLAYYHDLTNLPNRALLRERLSYVLEQAERYERLVAILSLDLDQFRRINDTLGHSLGDELLRKVADRLAACVRHRDLIARKRFLDSIDSEAEHDATIAHLGGDEFVALLTEIGRAEDAAIVAQRITESLSKPFDLDGNEVVITASIGIALYPINGKDVEVLLKNADAALHHAKERGRNSYEFYSEGINVRAHERLSLENSLRKAVENEDFQLYYQPKIDLQTGIVTGVEALLRWQHLDKGTIPPAEFIPLAEESGLIVPLGAWVLHAACAQNKAWQDANLPPMRVSVNISARQFKKHQLAHTINDVISKTGLDPRYLEIEITEGLLMEDTDISGKILEELKSMGLHIALDDFGTGYSSLSYLKRFPIDTLKIDQSFIRDITTDPDDAAIVTAIVALSKSLRLNVIAEGVETKDQLKFLVKHQCHEVQGYFFSVPLPGDAFCMWLLNRWLANDPGQLPGKAPQLL